MQWIPPPRTVWRVVKRLARARRRRAEEADRALIDALGTCHEDDSSPLPLIDGLSGRSAPFEAFMFATQAQDNASIKLDCVIRRFADGPHFR